MMLVNYYNFDNVVTENIIKHGAFGLNDKCVSFAIYLDFIDLETFEKIRFIIN